MVLCKTLHRGLSLHPRASRRLVAATTDCAGEAELGKPVALAALVGAAFATLVSLAAVGLAIFALTRPQRDLVRLTARVGDLSSLRTEWQDTLAALDSMNKRSARLARLEESRASAPAPAPAAPADGRRRTLSLAEVTGRKEA